MHRPLPVFQIAPLTPDYALFYTPGYLAAVRAELAGEFRESIAPEAPARWAAAVDLRRHALAALQAREALAADPYAPFCLTLYLNNDCNLACHYCFSADGAKRPGGGARLALETIRAAAALVARNCALASRPGTVVFHGGGEPTLDPDALRAALAVVTEAAAAHGLQLFRYIATNGVMPAATARWVAEHFDLVGLSCDGPAPLQARQRPMPGDADTTPFVWRTAEIVRAAGKPLHVRVTVTPATLAMQAQIAEYVCQALHPTEIHVEPVYQGGRAGAAVWDEACAEAFVAEFWRARGVARSYGVRWLSTGSRPGDVHGPYCQIARQVLQVGPSGQAAACFKTVIPAPDRPSAQSLGGLDPAGDFGLDLPLIETLRQALRREPAACAECFNRYHCVRGCPDHCALDGDLGLSMFRCQVQRRLSLAYLHETAAALCQTGQPVIGAIVRF